MLFAFIELSSRLSTALLQSIWCVIVVGLFDHVQLAIPDVWRVYVELLCKVILMGLPFAMPKGLPEIIMSGLPLLVAATMLRRFGASKAKPSSLVSGVWCHEAILSSVISHIIFASFIGGLVSLVRPFALHAELTYNHARTIPPLVSFPDLLPALAAFVAGLQAALFDAESDNAACVTHVHTTACSAEPTRCALMSKGSRWSAASFQKELMNTLPLAAVVIVAAAVGAPIPRSMAFGLATPALACVVRAALARVDPRSAARPSTAGVVVILVQGIALERLGLRRWTTAAKKTYTGASASLSEFLIGTMKAEVAQALGLVGVYLVAVGVAHVYLDLARWATVAHSLPLPVAQSSSDAAAGAPANARGGGASTAGGAGGGSASDRATPPKHAGLTMSVLPWLALIGAGVMLGGVGGGSRGLSPRLANAPFLAAAGGLGAIVILLLAGCHWLRARDGGMCVAGKTRALSAGSLAPSVPLRAAVGNLRRPAALLGPGTAAIAAAPGLAGAVFVGMYSILASGRVPASYIGLGVVLFCAAGTAIAVAPTLEKYGRTLPAAPTPPTMGASATATTTTAAGRGKKDASASITPEKAQS